MVDFDLSFPTLADFIFLYLSLYGRRLGQKRLLKSSLAIFAQIRELSEFIGRFIMIYPELMMDSLSLLAGVIFRYATKKVLRHTDHELDEEDRFHMNYESQTILRVEMSLDMNMVEVLYVKISDAVSDIIKKGDLYENLLNNSVDEMFK